MTKLFFCVILADLDYISARHSLTLSPTQRRHLFNISIHDDSILEANEKETFTLKLTVPNSPENVKLASSEINVIIKDNDRK